MERKRNRPEKYDRELLHKTVTAVQKITEVRLLPLLQDGRPHCFHVQKLTLASVQLTGVSVVLVNHSILTRAKLTSPAVELTGGCICVQVRAKRQERHYQLRMAKAKPQQVKAKKAQLENEIHLIKAPASLRKEAAKEKIPVETAQQTEAMQE